MLSRMPQHRLIRPEEVADAIVFLMSEAAAGVNGAALPLDGEGARVVSAAREPAPVEPPAGRSRGVFERDGRAGRRGMLAVAGQIGWDERGKLVSDDSS